MHELITFESPHSGCLSRETDEETILLDGRPLQGQRTDRRKRAKKMAGWSDHPALDLEPYLPYPTYLTYLTYPTYLTYLTVLTSSLPHEPEADARRSADRESRSAAGTPRRC